MCPFGVSFCESGYFLFLLFWEVGTSLLFQPCPLVLYGGDCSLSTQVSCCFLCIWVFLLNICMYHMFVCCLLRSEERALESLELRGCWNISLVLCKSMKPLYPLSHLSSPPWSLLDRIYVLCLFLRNELCSRLLHNAESTDWHWVSSAIALHCNFWG